MKIYQLKSIFKLKLLAATSLSCFVGISFAQSPGQLYIKNGVDVVEGDKQFQVLIQTKSEAGVYGVCGGSVIDKYWVLTAAHCFEDGRALDVIVGGSPYLDSADIEYMSPDGAFTHPNYEISEYPNGNLEYIKNDIALVRLKQATSLPRLRLANAELVKKYGKIGATGEIAGWGNTEPGGIEIPRTLQKTEQKITSQSCGHESAFICASGTDAGTCNGDSGGALTVKANGAEYGMGVLSYAHSSCEAHSAYTNISKYLDWIGHTKEDKLANAKVNKTGWGVRSTEICKAPSNHVITGWGGSMTSHRTIATLKLQVRPILSDGGLGAKSYVKCGHRPDANTQRFVELPDGHVLTGFAAHSQKKKFVGVTAYGKMYDPLSMSLVGNTKTLYNGTNGKEVNFNASTKNTIVTGIGLRGYKSNFRGFHAYLADIKQTN